MGRVIDSKDEENVIFVDGILTVYAGYGEDAHIKSFVIEGRYDNPVTLKECREMILPEKDHWHVITVIFESFTYGKVYKWGNHGNFWEIVGETEGFA